MRIAAAMLVVFFVSQGRADDAAKVKELLDKAIAAQSGSPENQAKLRRLTHASKGIMKTASGDVTAQRDIAVQWGDKPEFYRLNVVLELDDGKHTATICMEGLTKGTARNGNGPKADVPLEEIDCINRDIYAAWLTTLLPLKDGSFTITPLPETKFGKSTYIGLKVEKRFRPTVEMYFDPKTLLLARTVFKGKEAGVEVKKEFVYSDYKEFDKIKLPTHEQEFHDGRKRNDWLISEYRFPEKFDMKIFE